MDSRAGRGRYGDRRRDVDMRGLPYLALMAGLDVPRNVALDVGPPEPVADERASREDAPMADVVVELDERLRADLLLEHALVLTVLALLPQPAVVVDEEVDRETHEGLVRFVVHAGGSREGFREPLLDLVELLVERLRVRGTRER